MQGNSHCYFSPLKDGAIAVRFLLDTLGVRTSVGREGGMKGEREADLLSKYSFVINY